MRKTVRLVLVALMAIQLAHAQTPIGLNHDVNGMPLNGYFDPLTYAPDKKVSEVYNSDSYETGHYYDKSGKKVSGMIKFKDKKIWFKDGENEFSDKLKPEDVESFVIGGDSFFTVRKYYYGNVLKTTPVYVQFISAFSTYTVAKHYHFKVFVAQGQSPIVEEILIRSKGGDTWENFPDNKNFKEKAIKYFDHIPYLKDKIASGEYESKDGLSIIKMAEYSQKYEGDSPVLFDSYWQETRDAEKAKYLAKIIDKRDSIWAFEYYRDTTKLYTAHYSSFYPNIKNGEFTAYYPSGAIRQIVFYKNNKPKEVKIFYETGSLNTHYQYVENKDPVTSNTTNDIQYIAVNDSLGNNILKENGISTITYFDRFSDRTYTKVFDKREMISLYRLTGSDTIFQITDPRYDFKINQFQKRFNYYMADKKYDEALSVNAQGTFLISVVIDRKGYVVEGSVLNEIHPELDKLVARFLKNNILEGTGYRFRFKPYKSGKLKKNCEVIIPIAFEINRFYRPPVGYNHFINWNMFNPTMHQPLNITPPSMPRSF